MASSVLILADCREIASLVASYVVGGGYRPLVAGDLGQAAKLLERDPAAAVVLDLATPGHADVVLEWLRRDPARAAMAVVQVSLRARSGSATRGERADVVVPKPFTARQIADAVRNAIVRRSVVHRGSRTVSRCAI